ncbi:dihydroxyacetone kinase subunit DhaL [Aquibacillus saliphilus]|uniref:dihydroxyacetone kinase subunit DhaL n=1 Tax=Aquibacillus saliphilus TaxID=1909422 RepID=UPI001CEFCB93|nr:dihydroxyacetone kinase subunit DhaL [Aquibacillus saliphilus]
MNFTAKELINYFKQVVEVMENEKNYLCELDRKLGDGDHGVTMSIGWQAVNKKLTNELENETDCGKISSEVGMTFLNAVGSSVGPLYATGLIKGAKVVKGKSVLNDSDLAEFWIAFANGIKERGKAEVGDKTIVDTLAPAAKTLEENFAESGDFLSAFNEAVKSGEEGMKSTTDLISRLGRSSRLGERSKGAQDPGATSAYMMLSTFLTVVKMRSE